jgi:hypothetical protein
MINYAANPVFYIQSLRCNLNANTVYKPDIRMKNSNGYPPIGVPARETILCVSCLKENNQGEVFCRYCNAALGLTDNPDPIQRTAHEGAVYSKAVEGKPTRIVLIGVWLLFFPVLVFCATSAVSLAFGGEAGSISFVLFWVLIIVSLFSLTMIYKVTRNYLKHGEKDNL